MLSSLRDAYLARVQVLLDAGKHDEARDLAHELAESLRRHVEAGACLPVRREVLS
jgi:hypothetical protein